jgi:hypothetical protein
MRKNLASVLLTGCALASTSLGAAPAPRDTDPSAAAVAVQHVRMPIPAIRDEAAMVLVGTALIGLAAAVRRAA